MDTPLTHRAHPSEGRIGLCTSEIISSGTQKREGQGNLKYFPGNLFRSSPTRLPSPLARPEATVQRSRLTAGIGSLSSLPSLSRSPASRRGHRAQLSPSLQPSPRLWPQSSPNRPSLPVLGPSRGAPGPPLPAPPAPAPPATLHPRRRCNPSGAQDTGS